MKIMNDKSGWIKILEAFIMIILLTGLILVVLDRSHVGFESKENVYAREQAILRDIEINNSLRDTILNSGLPLEWNNFPNNLKYKINQTEGFDCTARICALGDNCVLNASQSKNVYTQSVMISANLNKYDPRRLRIFCSEK